MVCDNPIGPFFTDPVVVIIAASLRGGARLTLSRLECSLKFSASARPVAPPDPPVSPFLGQDLPPRGSEILNSPRMTWTTSDSFGEFRVVYQI